MKMNSNDSPNDVKNGISLRTLPNNKGEDDINNLSPYT